MLLKSEQLAGHLERSVGALYMAYGDAPLLILEAADAIRAAARRDGYTERQILTVLPGFDWKELSSASTHLSLFGDKKLIELRMPNGKPGREGGAALVDYCQRVTEGKTGDVILFVSLMRLEWKEEKSAWFSALSKAGIVLKLDEPSLAELPRWIAGRLARQNQRTDEEGLRFIAEHVEGNLLAAHQEIQKLAILYPAGSVSLKDIRESLINVARYSVDDVRESLLARNLPRFSRVLGGLKQEGEAPTLILWALTEEIRALAQLKAGLARGQPQDALFREHRIFGGRQTLMRRTLPAISGKTLKTALNDAARLDRAIKGVDNSDVWEGFLRLGMLLAH